jgi:hypothetical protein
MRSGDAIKELQDLAEQIEEPALEPKASGATIGQAVSMSSAGMSPSIAGDDGRGAHDPL